MQRSLEEYISLIENKLSEYNPVRDNPQVKIYEAMNYSLGAGGKRLRPILLLEFCRIFGGREEDAMPFACALEMIHTYSLIHDDLPAMDNDELRRGKPTNHIVFGEAAAILAGDALLTKAFEICSKPSGCSAERQIRAINMLASFSGTDGMVGGQVVDLESENKDISMDTLRYMHSLKTGALIKAACMIGAVIGGADESGTEAAGMFAENLGIAFQIRDDILDVTGSEEELGKKTGSDEKLKKNTYVTFLGVKKSQELCREYSDKALKALDDIDSDTEFLAHMVGKLVDRNS